MPKRYHVLFIFLLIVQLGCIGLEAGFQNNWFFLGFVSVMAMYTAYIYGRTAERHEIRKRITGR